MNFDNFTIVEEFNNTTVFKIVKIWEKNCVIFSSVLKTGFSLICILILNNAQNLKFPGFWYPTLIGWILYTFQGYKHKIRLVLRLRKRKNQALISISTILKFPDLNTLELDTFNPDCSIWTSNVETFNFYQCLKQDRIHTATISWTINATTTGCDLIVQMNNEFYVKVYKRRELIMHNEL